MFLITGSGRSGTSAVAQLLHEAGLSVGHDLIEPDEHNAEGYFEERMVIMINDAILKAAGVGEWFTTATREQIREAALQYADYMRDQVKVATPAWKDPRFSWTLEPWLEMLPERPRLIVCLRSPAEVVASTLAYYAQGGDDAENAVKHVWRTQYERLLEIIAEYELDATCVEYAALHADPEITVAPLARFVGGTLDVRTVRRDLRHHAVPIPDDLGELYERVRGLGTAAVEP
jgi:hypothetical protein